MNNQNRLLSQRLVDVVMGQVPADLVIRNGRWACVQSGEIIPGTDIAISGEYIAYVGPNANHTIGPETVIIDSEDKFLVPGLLDGHMHVESGMLTVTEFVRAVIPYGTTGMFVDPHEIANVFGLRGVRLMVDEAAQQPIHVWVQVPSCVPSAPGLETPGATLGPDEVAQALEWDGIIGLGEMMNFPGVIAGDEKMHLEMAKARQAGKVIGGHYASPDLGLNFHAYVAGGADDDHEGTRMEDAIARVRQGLKAMIRLGSAWQDVAEGVRAITESGLDPRHFILCTDDSHCETLVTEGNVNRAVRQAISHGVAPLTAIQMATLNTAEHFGVSKQVGMIAPGRFADILIVPDLVNIEVETVIARGRVVAKEKKLQLELPSYSYPEWVRNSVKIKKALIADDFRLTSPHPGKVIANIIQVIENQAPTRHVRLELPVSDEEVHADISKDIAKVALIERHHASGRIQVGLVTGFGLLKSCAIASTVGHDCHNMIVVGTDEENMAYAANQLAEYGGGQIVVKDNQVLGLVRLPIAGIMSDERADIVAQQAKSVLAGIQSCGCNLNNPNMQISLLALVVIPELRISDLGLVDVNQFKFIPVLE